MYDPDVEDEEEALSMVNRYEWAIGNDIGVHTQWTQIDVFFFSNFTHVSNHCVNIKLMRIINKVDNKKINQSSNRQLLF